MHPSVGYKNIDTKNNGVVRNSDILEQAAEDEWAARVLL